MQVWIRVDPKRKNRFHRLPTCKQLRKRPAQGNPRELVQLDLELVHVRPCKTCYPDAPSTQILKRYCEICESNYACEHNGGVRVTTRVGHHRWVWPDTNQMPFYRMTS